MILFQVDEVMSVVLMQFLHDNTSLTSEEKLGKCHQGALRPREPREYRECFVASAVRTTSKMPIYVASSDLEIKIHATDIEP